MINMNSVQLEVKEYYIAYFDVLGYKQKINELGENNFLEIMYSTLLTSMDIFEFITGESEINFIGSNLKFSMNNFYFNIFSDNICISILKTNDEYVNYRLLLTLIRNLNHLQRNLMGQYNILIRGCITQGMLFCMNGFLYGSGLIKAHNFEDKIAIYPRIIIDDECKLMIEKYKRDESYYIYENLIEADKDGYSFISYMRDLKQGHCIDSVMYDYLVLHKYLLESEYKKQTDNRIIEKYIWCIQYHNKICDFYGNKECYIRLVDGKILSCQFKVTNMYNEIIYFYDLREALDYIRHFGGKLILKQ